ncbi:MAG: hypothetical protein ABIH86_00985 [Planctomycetota bacterium]
MGRKKKIVSSEDIVNNLFAKKKPGRPKKDAAPSEPAASVAEKTEASVAAVEPKKKAGRPKGTGAKKAGRPAKAFGAKKPGRPAKAFGAKKAGRPAKAFGAKKAGRPAASFGAKKADVVSAPAGKLSFVVSINGALNGFADKSSAESFLADNLAKGVSWKNVQVFGVINADPKASI